MPKEQIVYLPVKRLKPYKNNPRNNKTAVDAVAASIKKYGFRSPLQVKPDGTIINGHTRYAAAKKLGFEEVPCVVVSDLSEKDVREYRLIDNKSAEYATWNEDLLAGELADLDLDLDFDFDFSGDVKKRKRWEESKKRCDLKDRLSIRKAMDICYPCLFKAGNEGRPLAELEGGVECPLLCPDGSGARSDAPGGQSERRRLVRPDHAPPPARGGLPFRHSDQCGAGGQARDSLLSGCGHLPESRAGQPAFRGKDVPEGTEHPALR